MTNTTPTARPENEALLPVEQADRQLLPCPFCGGDAERITIEEPGDNFTGDVIQCMGVCGASSHVEFGRKENLVSLWNSRLASTPTALPGAEDVALREAVKLCAAFIMDDETLTLDQATDALLALIPRASDEVPANPVGEALKIALRALGNYADPTGYTDNDGEPYSAEDKHHPGALAQSALDEIAALAGKPADAASSQEQGA